MKKGITDSISNDAIDSIYDKAINAGAIGGKLLGAGGGGFILFYVEKDKQLEVKNVLENLLYIQQLKKHNSLQLKDCIYCSPFF